MDSAAEILDQIFGHADETGITIPQMAVRGVFIYVAVVVLLRIGKKRSLGNASIFDFFLGVLLGSIAGRAVTGDAPIPGTFAAAAAMVFVHWLFSRAAMNWHWLGSIIKGHPTLLVKDGNVIERGMRSSHLSANDLEGELRLHGVSNIGEVAEAWLERSGNVSVVRKPNARSS